MTQNDNGSASSYSTSQASQESDTLYQSGTMSAGAYANASYNYQDNAANTFASDAGGPGYSSSGTLTSLATTSIYASGSSSESSAGTYGYDTGSGASTLSNSSSATPGATSPPSVLQWSAIDGNLVPVVGADQSANGDAPVPVSISLTQVDNNQSLAANTDASARGMTSSAAGMFQYENSTSGGVTAAGRAIMHGRAVTGGVGDPALEAATAAVLSPNFMPAAAMPQLTNFSTQVWNSVQPVLQAMTWMNATVPQNSEYMQMPGLQQVLGIRLQQASMQPSKTGDPYVDWVDSMLYNNGQPLTAGSSPLYGSYWNGQSQSAGQALSMAAPYLEGGVYLVAGMWMVGPTAVLGAWCYAAARWRGPARTWP